MNEELSLGLEVEVGSSSPVHASADNTSRSKAEEFTPIPENNILKHKAEVPPPVPKINMPKCKAGESPPFPENNKLKRKAEESPPFPGNMLMRKAQESPLIPENMSKCEAEESSPIPLNDILKRKAEESSSISMNNISKHRAEEFPPIPMNNMSKHKSKEPILKNVSKCKAKESPPIPKNILKHKAEGPTPIAKNNMLKRKAEESSPIPENNMSKRKAAESPPIPENNMSMSKAAESPPIPENNMSKSKAKESTPIPKKKKSKILPGMKAEELLKILRANPIKFCQDMGLMANTVKCPCGLDMRLVKCTRGMSRDLCVWRCDRNGEGHHQTVRKGTWFEKSKMSTADILYVAYMWIHEYSLKAMLHESGLLEKTLREWCGSCLDLCQGILEHKCDPLGGEQKTVEIFQCSLKQAKERRGKWVFFALEQNTTKSLLVYVKDMSSDSVVQIFKKYFLPGTTVVARVWSFFESVTESDFKSLITENSLMFYDLVTKVKMDTFKEFEKKTRQRPGLLCKLKFDEGFYEKMYRKSLAFASDAYVAFMKDVSLIYEPAVVVVKNASKAVKD